jgi:hypothetical protein
MAWSFYRVNHDLKYDKKGFGVANFPQWWQEDLDKSIFCRYGKPAKDVGPLPEAELAEGDWADYLVNSGVYNLCSAKLVEVIEAHRPPTDVVEWVPVQVSGRPYFVLHLPVIHDVLDASRTKFHGQWPRRRVAGYSLNANAVRDRHIFGREGSGFDWIVSRQVRKAILAAGCTGLMFDPVAAWEDGVSSWPAPEKE